MKKNQVELLLYSAAGVAMVFAIVVALNIIVGAAPQRLDLTQDKAYTLSAGTKDILRSLDTPVRIRFYCTQPESSTAETIYLRNYARKVEDLLAEYKQLGGRNILLEKLDPQPNSDAEDSARLDGLQSQPVPGADQFYLGIAVSLADTKVALTFLAPNRERQLEYDLTRAIAQVTRPPNEKPVVGIMSPLGVFGMPSNPMMMQMGQQGMPTWTIVNELKADYTVKRIGMDVEQIDGDVKLLLLIHPKEITDKAQFALDQFVLRGGKLMAFVDAFSLTDRQSQGGMMGGGMQTGTTSTLPTLFKAWGLGFETGKVLADRRYMLRYGDRGQQTAPTILHLDPSGISGDSVATAQIDNLWLPFVGAFTGSPAAGLTLTPLLHSSKEAGFVDGFLANLSTESVLKELKPTGVEYVAAALLSGKFKTAFPEGPPGQAPADTNNPAPPATFLKEATADNTVVIFGDADLLFDGFTIRKMQSPFGELAMPMNQNLNLALNLVDQMAGDNRLTSIRNRASMNRPLTKLQELQSQAEGLFREKINSLQAERDKAQQRLNELQAEKDTEQRFILSPEQKAEIDNLRKKEVEFASQLRKVEKDLRSEVVALQTRYKWVNILAVPLAVTFAGLAIALIKRKRTSAK
jgi:ABC-type uncharacterized transport system involved in gliding motility auxiliary subunit